MHLAIHHIRLALPDSSQVFAVSSAGVIFAMVVEVPPLTLAAWRLQLTSVLLGVGAAVQLGRMPPADRRRTVDSAGLLAASGVCLCIHFGTWVYSVEATSLTHSLLLVSASPLFLAGGAWLLRQHISGGELGGTAMGLVGTVILATAAARSDAQVVPPPTASVPDHSTYGRDASCYLASCDRDPILLIKLAAGDSSWRHVGAGGLPILYWLFAGRAAPAALDAHLRLRLLVSSACVGREGEGEAHYPAAGEGGRPPRLLQRT